MKEINKITGLIIEASINVHKELGPGLLESASKHCLFHELENIGLFVRNEYPIPLHYKKVKLECGYRADLLVENKVIVEIKSVDSVNDLHIAQVLTYLKLANCKIGLLINFNVLRLTAGVKRLTNKYYDDIL